jgi:uncharacterized protein YdbL (DUF1318 family)
MLTLRIIPFALGLLFIAGVAINVSKPAAAEKAVEQNIEKVWQPVEALKTTSEMLQPGLITPTSEADDVWGTVMAESESITRPLNKSNNSFSSASSSSHWLTLWLDFFISPAYAEVLFDISNDAIFELQNRMAERHKKLQRFYDIGAIGLTNDGLIAWHDFTNVPLESLRKVRRWIEQENLDRLNLYYQMAVASGHPKWEASIRATFAKRWVKRAKPGWWYQDENRQWQRKE